MVVGRAVVLGACVVLAGACTEEDAPSPAAAAKEALKPAWRKVETPVPVGKKLKCASLLHADQATAAVGRQLEVKDESGRDPEATAVCRLMTVGKPPSEKEQERMLAKNQALGLLPGDELCQISLYCWSTYTVPDLKKRDLGLSVARKGTKVLLPAGSSREATPRESPPAAPGTR